jgi:hypothetical protein
VLPFLAEKLVRRIPFHFQLFRASNSKIGLSRDRARNNNTTTNHRSTQGACNTANSKRKKEPCIGQESRTLFTQFTQQVHPYVVVEEWEVSALPSL